MVVEAWLKVLIVLINGLAVCTPLSMEWWICTYVLMIFETSVLLHFGYALKIPEKFISKMVIFSVLMWSGPSS